MTSAGNYQLFVYGTLRSGFQHSAFEYISQFFSFACEAKVRGKLFDMGSYPAGVPTKEDSFITGELYLIKNPSEFSWAIGQLDDYEGVNVEPDEVQLYRREMTEVIAGDIVTQAWVYWFNGDTSDKPIVSSGDIFEYISSR